MRVDNISFKAEIVQKLQLFHKYTTQIALSLSCPEALLPTLLKAFDSRVLRSWTATRPRGPQATARLPALRQMQMRRLLHADQIYSLG
jgi:hypothetical protein